MSKVEYRYDEGSITMWLSLEQDGMLSIEAMKQGLVVLLSYLHPDAPRILVTHAIETAFYQVLQPEVLYNDGRH